MLIGLAKIQAGMDYYNSIEPTMEVTDILNYSTASMAEGDAQTAIVTTAASITSIVASAASASRGYSGSKNSYSVYQCTYAGKVRYVGITKRNPRIRFRENLSAKGTGRDLLRYRVVKNSTGLTRQQARTTEHKLINQYGLGNLLNQRSSIREAMWSILGI